MLPPPGHGRDPALRPHQHCSGARLTPGPRRLPAAATQTDSLRSESQFGRLKMIEDSHRHDATMTIIMKAVHVTS
ncbi:hypothetical protein E2C01_072252 [Portunus trituberculatus]|uniref:Uncharacterized protein n=1 Tax=Portunus trituberculatus TaxID=210409 RepID=A0A5B7I6M9_PORTR|nr:hypothetical protein [Portunus trituberculatus]